MLWPSRARRLRVEPVSSSAVGRAAAVSPRMGEKNLGGAARRAPRSRLTARSICPGSLWVHGTLGLMEIGSAPGLRRSRGFSTHASRARSSAGMAVATAMADCSLYRFAFGFFGRRFSAQLLEANFVGRALCGSLALDRRAIRTFGLGQLAAERGRGL